MIGRALASGPGQGPWWEYILRAPTLEAATRAAYHLARGSGVRVWLHQHGDDYVPLPDPETPPR
jgi:hypothetical protein